MPLFTLNKKSTYFWVYTPFNNSRHLQWLKREKEKIESCSKIVSSVTQGEEELIRWIVIYPLDSVILSLNNWAQIYNKGYSVTEFLFSHDNKVSQRDYNSFPSQSLYLTRYKNCPYRKSLVKEKSNSSKFKRRQDLDMISKLFSKNRKLKTILKIVNMKAIFAVMKLIWSI